MRCKPAHIIATEALTNVLDCRTIRRCVVRKGHYRDGGIITPVKTIAFVTMAIACAVLNAAIGAPTPQLPSERLSAFLKVRLDTIVAPFGGPGYGNVQELIDLRESFADGMVAAPAAGKPAYRAAMGVCEVIAQAISEREDAVARLSGCSSVHSGSDLGGIRRSNLKGWDGWVEEHREKREKKEREQVAAHTDAFFISALQVQWKQRTMQLRQLILNSYQRERQTERDVNLPGLLAAASVASAPVSNGAAATGAPANPALGEKEFRARLCARVWSWQPSGKKPTTLYFDPSGTAFNDDWVAPYSITDTHSVVIGTSRNTASLTFAPDYSSFSGIDFGGRGNVSGKQRAN